MSAANTTFWAAFYYLLFSLAAVALPYKRPDLWGKGVKKRIFGIPATAFIGALSTVGMLWLMALSTIGITLLAWNVSVLWMLIGVLVYVFYLRKSDKRGIKISDIYGEVPPP